MKNSLYQSLLAVFVAFSCISYLPVHAEESPTETSTPTPTPTATATSTIESEEPEVTEVTPLRFEQIAFDAAYQWSAVETPTPVDIISELEIQAFDKDNNPVEVYIKDDGGLDLTIPGTYTITIGAINPENNEEETTNFELTINGEEIATPLSSNCDASHNCVVTNWNDFVDAIQEANTNAPTPYTIVVNGTIQADATRTDAFVGSGILGLNGSNVTLKGTGEIVGFTTNTIPQNDLLVLTNDAVLTIDGITFRDHYASNGGGANNGELIQLGDGANILNLTSGTIKDCKGDGPAAAVEADGDDVINMYDGFTIKNNASIGQDAVGGAFNLWKKAGTNACILNMYGGLIEGNSAHKNGATDGGSSGAIRVDGDFNMYGGTIKGNEADFAGAVNIYQGTFTMEGGVITENKATIQNIGALYVREGTFTMTGGKITGNIAQTTMGAGYINSGTANLLGGEISNNKTLTSNIGGLSVENSSFLLDGTDIINNTAQASVGGLLVYNCSPAVMKSGSISNNVSTTGAFAGLYLSETQFVMDGGSINENQVPTASQATAGVFLQNNATFTMNGGTVNQNFAAGGNGGFYATAGTGITINGGTVERNTTNGTAGGAYIANNAYLILNDGSISNNSAGNTGGGVYAAGGSSVTVNGGKINNNTSTNAGGGIISREKVVITGGEIKGNTSAIAGGISIGTRTATVDANGASFTMTGGEISNNTATTGHSGGLYINDVTQATISGGTIANNTAATDGGGINIDATSVLNMTAGTVKGNTATGNGDGIIMSGTLNLSGTTSIDPDNDLYLDGTDHMVNVVGAFPGVTSAKPIQLTPSDTTTSTSTTVHGNQVVNYYSSDEAAKADVNDFFVPSYKTTGLTIIQDDVTLGGESPNYLILGVRSTLEFVTNGGSSIPTIGLADGTVLTNDSKYNYSTTLSTRPGYTLEGWYEDAALTIPVSSTTLMVGPLMKVYAKWERNPDPSTRGPWLVTYLDCLGNTVKVEWVEDGQNSSKPSGNYPDVNNVTFHETVYPIRCDVRYYNIPNTGV